MKRFDSGLFLIFLHGALQFLPLRVIPVMETGVADDVWAQENSLVYYKRPNRSRA